MGGEFVLLIRGAARPTIYPLALTEVGVNGKAGASKNSQFSSESNVDVVVERYNLKLCTRVLFAPAEPFTDFSFLARCYFFSFCLGCLRFTGSPNSNAKKWFRKRLGREIEHVPKFEGLSLKIVVDIKSFVRQRENKYGLAT